MNAVLARAGDLLVAVFRTRSATAVGWLLALALVLVAGWFLERQAFEREHTSGLQQPLDDALPGYRSGGVQVRRGDPATYGGATFRLESVRSDVGPVDYDGRPEAVEVPVGTTYLVATFRVTLPDQAARKDLSCFTAMVDGRTDRLWAAGYGSLPQSTSCDGGYDERALDFRFQQAYVVPTGLAAEVRPALWMTDEAPRFLLFER